MATSSILPVSGATSHLYDRGRSGLRIALIPLVALAAGILVLPTALNSCRLMATSSLVISSTLVVVVLLVASPWALLSTCHDYLDP